jgi:hypothetical protein
MTEAPQSAEIHAHGWLLSYFHGYKPHIRQIGEEKLDERGEKTSPARRWVVERTIGWLSKCYALLVRLDKEARRGSASAEIHYLGLIQLDCMLLWYRRCHRLGLLRLFLIDNLQYPARVSL